MSDVRPPPSTPIVQRALATHMRQALRVKDMRNIFSVMRARHKQCGVCSPHAATFMPCYGMTFGEFAVVYVLTE